ncbi:MAG: hypothetical protein KF685_00440 [Acidobacteria bacterium]|nr:hypothetical protein [Acidobacteriota bacterium]
MSAAAYYLLQTVFDDYNPKPDIQLIPCCGIPICISETDPTEPIICGCPNGVNWTIKHDGYLIKHCFDDGEIIETDLHEWRMSVVKFSHEVMKFFENSKQKQGNDNEEHMAFQLFWKKWKDIRAKAE